MTQLSRTTAGVGAAPPVAVVHLGLGAFHRAHQAWYAQHTVDSDACGIAAYAGRRPDLAAALTAQDGLYTLLTRGADADRAELVSSISRAHTVDETNRWLDDLCSSQVTTLTITVTEAGYRRDAAGMLDVADRDVQADIDALKHDLTSTVFTAPARLAQGLIARVRASAGRLDVISCDNLAANGAATRRVVLALVEAVFPDAVAEIEAQVNFVSSVVDRITPATTDADRELVRELTAFDDTSPVVTEPFSEWIIEDRLTASSPNWASAGAIVVGDVTPFEQRKLWLLNAGHSLLAYAGSIHGYRTVAEAVRDDTLHALLQSLWDAAAGELPFSTAETDAYRAALLTRFDNARIEHRLAQIAADGAQKIPLRVLPVIGRRRERNLPVLPGQITAVAAWLAHLRGHGAPIRDDLAQRFAASLDAQPRVAATRLLQQVAPDLADDTDLVVSIADACMELERVSDGPNDPVHAAEPRRTVEPR